MKQKLMIVVLGVATMVALALTVPQVFAQQSNTPPAAARGRRGAEPHPEIRRAIMALEAAKRAMQNAAHDFGGHRVAALAECDKAIEQLQEALKYDKE